jgi:spore coat polysaccharide biosynthesis protein SpsF
MEELLSKGNNTIAFIIQARLGSTRLPNKMILPFYKGFSIFEILIEKLKRNFENIPIIVATSLDTHNDILEQIALENNIFVFRGDESNVLKRFINAAEQYGVNKIIRICADNPFLDGEELKKLLAFVEHHPTYDYVSFNVNDTPSIKTHFGFWAEYVSLDALKKADTLIQESIYYEHVTNYIYEHSKIFDIAFIQPNEVVVEKKDIRMTLDTLQDFEILAEIYERLQNEYNDNWGINEIISFLDKNFNYKEKMLQQIDKNSK